MLFYAFEGHGIIVRTAETMENRNISNLMYLGITLYFNPIPRNNEMTLHAARSPIYAHLNTTLSGLSSIRGSGFQSLFKRKFEEAQDERSGAYYLYLATSTWLVTVLDWISLFYTLGVIVGFLAVQKSEDISVLLLCSICNTDYSHCSLQYSKYS
jgi:ABC-type multidrug transport system fused ATPase/permease subunit